MPKDYLTQNLIGHFHYMLGRHSRAATGGAPRASSGAAASAAPQNDVLFYNLGLIYRRNGLFAEALAAFGRSHAINPRPIPGRDRARAASPGRGGGGRGREAALWRPTSRRGIGGGAVGHLEMAEQLERRGEVLAARGHRLRAEEGGAPHGGEP